jgi:hypothetical protein
MTPANSPKEHLAFQYLTEFDAFEPHCYKWTFSIFQSVRLGEERDAA